MGALNLRLRHGQAAYGRLQERDFEVRNMLGVLCVAFADASQVYSLPERKMTYGFNGLTITPLRQQNDGSIRFAATGTPLLHEANHMNSANAETAEEKLYIAIQEYWLDGDYSEQTKHAFLDELEDRLDYIEQNHSVDVSMLDNVFDYVEEGKGIAALIEVEQLIQTIKDNALVSIPVAVPDAYRAP